MYCEPTEESLEWSIYMYIDNHPFHFVRMSLLYERERVEGGREGGREGGKREVREYIVSSHLLVLSLFPSFPSPPPHVI